VGCLHFDRMQDYQLGLDYIARALEPDNVELHFLATGAIYHQQAESDSGGETGAEGLPEAVPGQPGD